MARTEKQLNLKPCPFCGSKFPWVTNYVEWDIQHGAVHKYKISCCVAQMRGYLTYHAAALEWNKRRSEERTSERIASSAAKILRSKKASKAAKSVAASALTQKTRR